MREHGTHWRITALAARAAAAAVLGSLGTVPTVTDTPRSAASSTQSMTGHSTDPGVTHPAQDYAGSTIREHHGAARTVEPKAFAQALPRASVSQTPGMDVSAWQRNVDWVSAYRNGARFAYVKATEGTGYVSPYFAQQYNGSYQVGMVRGAYHFALPDVSSGAVQADYFVRHGGGWSADGKTLPPMLDIEYNPYQGNSCYGLSQTGMVSWIKSFSDEVHAKTSRWPTIYSTTDWWRTCTGDSAAFGNTNPLFVAHYSSNVGTLSAGWDFYTFWQYSDAGPFPGDQDRFNGAMRQLRTLATGTSSSPRTTVTAAPPSSSTHVPPSRTHSAPPPPATTTSSTTLPPPPPPPPANTTSSASPTTTTTVNHAPPPPPPAPTSSTTLPPPPPPPAVEQQGGGELSASTAATTVQTSNSPAQATSTTAAPLLSGSTHRATPAAAAVPPPQAGSSRELASTGVWARRPFALGIGLVVLGGFLLVLQRRRARRVHHRRR